MRLVPKSRALVHVFVSQLMRGSGEGADGLDPLKNHENIGFLAIMVRIH